MASRHRPEDAYAHQSRAGFKNNEPGRRGQPRKLVTALYDYQATADTDLSFNAGDQMEVSDDTLREYHLCSERCSQGQWWEAIHVTSRRAGLIPANYVRVDSFAAEVEDHGGQINSHQNDVPIENQPWYFGKLGIRETEKMLLEEGVPLGGYVVRDSKSIPEAFALSVKNWSANFGFHVKHFQIKPTADVSGYYITRTDVFPSIDLIIKEYSKSKLKDCHHLTQPYDRSRLQAKQQEVKVQGDTFEVDRTEIKLMRLLHQGKRKVTWNGSWRNKICVAVKVIEHESPELMNEIDMLKKLRHPNIVTLLALCTIDDPIYIVQEYLPKGSLLSLLESSEGNELTIFQLNNIAVQIADGMVYLGDMRYVLRTLAARNVLIGEKLCAKLSDFSHIQPLNSSDEFIADEGSRYPIKWTAPESLTGKFTVKSDIWSYGILLMELYTYGQTPYPNMNGNQVMDQVRRGYRMPKPRDLVPEIYEIMLECWRKDPADRPSFRFLIQTFQQIKITENFSIDLEDESYVVMKQPDIPIRPPAEMVPLRSPQLDARKFYRSNNDLSSIKSNDSYRSNESYRSNTDQYDHRSIEQRQTEAKGSMWPLEAREIDRIKPYFDPSMRLPAIPPKSDISNRAPLQLPTSARTGYVNHTLNKSYRN